MSTLVLRLGASQLCAPEHMPCLLLTPQGCLLPAEKPQAGDWASVSLAWSSSTAQYSHSCVGIQSRATPHLILPSWRKTQQITPSCPHVSTSR